jgi:succinate dehydrogenase/fumarate reductase flavoprotein subunit
METIERDVVVVGAGGAGMTAALVAAKLGLEVLLVEKTECFGGTTAWSGGGVWAPCNSLARDAGIDDSREMARRYVMESVGPSLRNDLLEAFLDNVADMVDFLQGNSEVQFSLQTGFPDWHPDVAGFSPGGRLVTPENFDGKRLGPLFPLLKPPLTEFNAPGGMMLGLDDMPHIANVKKSWHSFRHIASLLLRYFWDRMRHHRGTRLTMGNALAARLLYSCQDAGVQLWANAPMLRLTTEQGAVTGAVVECKGEAVTVRARRGVILASGGFSGNAEMREQFIPFAENHVSLVSGGNVGDGISNALALGAQYDGENISNAGWVVVSVLEQPDGSLRKFPHLFLDRGKPGCIAVNSDGKRFGNESATNLVEPMHSSGSVPAHLICDHSFIKRYGLGMVRPGGIGLKKMLQADYVVSAASISELADVIGANRENLMATVARFNDQAEAGVDEDFGRGGQASDFSMGDPGHAPNPCLGPIVNGPFYAVKIYPGDSTTTVGLKVDAQARVLGGDGAPIPGLQAIGLDMNSLWRGCAPGNGANNTLSLTFGYIAARTLADVT